MSLIEAARSVFRMARGSAPRSSGRGSQEAEAFDTRRMLERVVEEGFDGIVILNARDEVVRLNGNARRLLRLAPAAGTLLASTSLPRVMLEEVRALRRSSGTGHRTSLLRETEIADGPRERRWLEFTVTPIDIGEDAEETYLCLTLRDITDRRRAAAEVQRMAMRDSLTGLLNRRGLQEAILKFGPEGAESFTLIYFDLDRFKNINDGLGHGAGDDLLIQIGRRALHCLAGREVARLGGDEFAALVRGPLADAKSQAYALLEAIGKPFSVLGHQISIGASVGLAFCPGGQPDLAALMQQADLALYDAKSRGGGHLSVFEPGMERDRRDRLALEQDLSGALDRREIHLVYQPQVLIGSGELVGVEALMRWTHPSRGVVSPAVFIPLAEETGFIHRLTRWLVETACAEAASWPTPISLAINVSPADLQSGDIPRLVGEALAKTGLAPARLELEITENAFLQGGAAVDDAFHEVRDLGVEFALDDFGTGYSSLGYLHRYPFAKLKIDRSFVSGIPRDQQAMAILRSTIMLAQGLGMRTIAEGVETEGQRETLRLLGCQYAQGYLFSRPISSEALTRLLTLDSIVPWNVREQFNAAG